MINDNIYKCMNIVMTNKCDKQCPYCDFPSIEEDKQGSITINQMDYIEEYLYYIAKRNSETDKHRQMVILGGELGLLDDKVLYELLNISNKIVEKYGFNSLIWMTNGLLFEAHPFIYHKHLFEIEYHILDDNLDNFSFIDDEYITYNVVLTPYNENKVTFLNKLFLSNNKMLHIKPVNSIRNSYTDYIASGHNSLSDKYNYKLFNKYECNKTSPFFAIDFTNNTIFKCCRSYTRFERKLLTYNNLEKAYSGKLFDKDDICNSCYRLAYY